jgi:GNAT superfamily N-acetyltransferase
VLAKSCPDFPSEKYLAIRPGDTPELLGFACWDATALGFFGPTGVAEEARGTGIGNALLQSCLHAMREQGYGYAIIGSASKNALDFYRKTLPASSQFLEGSKPGVYKNMLKAAVEKPKS